MTKMRCAILLMLPGLSAATDALGSNFLEANAKKDGVVSLPSGLQYKVLRAGRLGADTARALPHSPCEIHYEGRVVKEYIISPTSQSFDSTYSVGLPVTVKPKDETKVIKGWAEALQLMVPGDKWELYIPSELAYGAEGMHEKTKGFISGLEIDGNQALIYTFELLTVQYDGAIGEVLMPAATPFSENCVQLHPPAP
jgi:FKBP-type peptidyl-prolyl cis-trans isomerase FklB